MNELEGLEVLMTDVYKNRTRELAKKSIIEGKSVIIETVFYDKSFTDIADLGRDKKYKTSLVVLFLDNLSKSMKRVAFWGTQQTGITISGGNVKINFNESFKNVATYFFYFDYSDIYRS